ncbi:MAG: A/G-specific adenine glycosylase [Acidimicrobiia bacterium]
MGRNHDHDHNHALTVGRSTSACTRNADLLAWYAQHGRSLPWRTTNDPYPVVVSEVMLQQTQVSRAIPRYERWLARWPTEHDLAEATNTEVLRAWSGLGYNSRAIRLRDTAAIVSRDGWPTSPDGLRDLPGIGPYTANAVASICFGWTVPAVDTNLRRVLTRWLGTILDGPELDAYANRIVATPAGDWNQAIMDLGATICLPSDPRCELCPVAGDCADPSIRPRVPAQSPFEGSHRQLRGALVKAALDGTDPVEVGISLGRSPQEVRTAIDTLHSEGLIVEDHLPV